MRRGEGSEGLAVIGRRREGKREERKEKIRRGGVKERSGETKWNEERRMRRKEKTDRGRRKGVY